MKSFKDIEFIDLTGTSINEINNNYQLLSANVLTSDLFLVCQPELSNVKPDRKYVTPKGEKFTNYYKTCKIDYDSLSDITFNTICSLFGFQTMAWELSDHYSLIDHKHNYSKVSAYSVIKFKQNEEALKDNYYNLGKINIDSKDTLFYMPKIKLYNEPKPVIGQLKFFAWNKNLPILPNNDSFYDSKEFNGWVYPDGRSLSRVRFPEASEYFGSDYGGDGTMFNVPLLTEFIKPVSNVSNKDDIINRLCEKQQQSVPSHTHNLDNSITFSGNQSYEISVATGDNSSSQATHSWTSNSLTGSATVTGTLVFNMRNFSMATQPDISNSAEELNVDTYPTYNYLPVMIYIGGEENCNLLTGQYENGINDTRLITTRFDATDLSNEVLITATNAINIDPITTPYEGDIPITMPSTRVCEKYYIKTWENTSLGSFYPDDIYYPMTDATFQARWDTMENVIILVDMTGSMSSKRNVIIKFINDTYNNTEFKHVVKNISIYGFRDITCDVEWVITVDKNDYNFSSALKKLALNGLNFSGGGDALETGYDALVYAAYDLKDTLSFFSKTTCFIFTDQSSCKSPTYTATDGLTYNKVLTKYNIEVIFKQV